MLVNDAMKVNIFFIQALVELSVNLPTGDSDYVERILEESDYKTREKNRRRHNLKTKNVQYRRGPIFNFKIYPLLKNSLNSLVTR